MRFVLRPCPLKNVDCFHLFVGDEEIAVIQSRQVVNSRERFRDTLKQLVEQANNYDGLCK